jgi:Bifunctional DNA primase/polymerase, N-terminal/Primase C terminal 1 (PriCT-1)
MSANPILVPSFPPDAVELIQALFEENDQILLHVFKSSPAVCNYSTVDFSAFKSEGNARTLQDFHAQKCSTFVLPCSFRAGTTEPAESLIETVRSFALDYSSLNDLDTTIRKDGVLAPHYVLQCGADFVAIWLLSDFSVEQAKTTLQSLAEKTHAVKESATLLNLILLPGTPNFETAEEDAPVCQIIQRSDENFYEPADFMKQVTHKSAEVIPIDRPISLELPAAEIIPADKPISFEKPVAQSVIDATKNAERLLNRGLSITPLRPMSKIAFVPEWQNHLITTQEQVREIVARHGNNLNWAVVAKAEPSGICILDADRPDIIGRIEKETGESLAISYRVRSQKGKGHIYFKQTAASIALGNVKIADEEGEVASFRCDNTYCVAEGSIHPVTKMPYECVSDAEIQPAPNWLIDWLKANQNAERKITAESSSPLQIVHEGGRDNFLTSQGGRLRYSGAEYPEILSVLKRVNENQCVPPMDESDVERIAHSVARYPVGQPTTVLMNGRVAGENPAVQSALPAAVATPSSASALIGKTTDADEGMSDEGSRIPPFDPSTMTGLCKEMAELAIRGTTIPPQFCYLIARTYLGLRMAASGVKFPDLNVESRKYAALTGVTGTSKGESWRRMKEIIWVDGTFNNLAACKYYYSADSGPGLKDAFLEPPSNLPILLYVDEVIDLGSASAEKRNPSTLHTMLTLADDTTFSRVKAKSKSKGGAPADSGAVTKNDARLAVVMCGQSGEVYTKAFAGTTKVGWFDRLYPEYATPVESGKLPPIDPRQIAEIMMKLNQLPWGQRMIMPANLDAQIEAFVRSLPKAIRTKNRWIQQLRMDIYISAFSRGSLIVNEEDIEGAFRAFHRTTIIRRVCFGGEAPDRVGFYLGQMERCYEGMLARLAKGEDSQKVALSKQDFLNMTSARRDREQHIFEGAWRVFEKNWLAPITIKRANGRVYQKFLPLEQDPGE